MLTCSFARLPQPVKMGAMMGSLVGLTIGFIGGSFQILRAGPGPRGTLATLSQYMLSSGATFAFFLSIGQVIRSDQQHPIPHPLLANNNVHILRQRFAVPVPAPAPAPAKRTT